MTHFQKGKGRQIAQERLYFCFGADKTVGMYYCSVINVSCGLVRYELSMGR